MIGQNGWDFDMDSAPRTNQRILLLAPPYGAGSGNWVERYDGEGRWNLHFVLNNDVRPIAWQHLPKSPMEKQP